MIALWISAAHAHVPILYILGPEDDWCGFLNQTATSGGETLYPGDVVILRSGEYGRCAFTAQVTDTDTEFTIVQSENPDQPARFVHDGGPEPLLDIRGTHLFLYDLSIEDVPAGGTGIRLEDATTVWMRFGAMSGIAGTGLSVTGASDDIWVLDDRFETVEGGTAVSVTNTGSVRIRDDLFTGAGTGVHAGPGPRLEVSDVVFSGSGTGVSLTTGDGVATQMVSANLFLDHALAIDVRGGPALVRNNIVRASTTAIRAADDGSGTFSGVRVLGNSFAGGEVDLAALSAGTHEIADNAGVDGMGTGNVACAAGCFRDAAANDFYPQGPLLDAGEGTSDDALYEDFCGQQRVEPRTAGALQWVGDIGWDPLTVRMKEDFQCSIEGPPGQEPEDTGFEETGDVTGPKKCGCASAGQRGGWTLLLLAATAAIRRRASGPDRVGPPEG